VFFEYAVCLPDNVGQVHATAWSNGDHRILAVATGNGQITMYHEEGDAIEPAVDIKRSGKCTHMAWHPKLALLACGWDDGTVWIWSESDRQHRENSITHQHPISLLQWSPDGSRLISGDEGGMLGVWQASAGRLVLHYRYSKKGAVKHLVFRCAAGEQAPGTPCPPFFFSGASGVVYFADDLNHCTEVVKLGSGVKFMYYSHAQDYICFVTNDVTMHKWFISPDGTLTQDRKVKLSIRGDGSNLRCMYAGNGLLAAANNEAMVRFWHMEKDDNYFLTLSDPRHMADIKDPVQQLAFNHRGRVLVGACASGRVVMWQHVADPDSKADPSDSDWDVLPSVETDNSITLMDWGPESGLLSVAYGDTCSILNQATLYCKAAYGNAIIQMTADTVFLQHNEGLSKKVQSSIRIKGIDISDQYVVVWNGKQAEVRECEAESSAGADDWTEHEDPASGQKYYHNARTEVTTWEKPTGAMDVYSSFPTKARMCAIREETIYAAVGHRLDLMSMEGVVKRSISFTEEEGNPVLLDINTQYLAMATDIHILRLWDISRAEPKQVVPGRTFESCPGVIKSIRVNANGTKVSLLCNRMDAAGTQTPDSKMYVYDVELDRVFEYDFGPAFFPVNHFWDKEEHMLIAVETQRFELMRVPAQEEEQPLTKVVNAEIITLFATSEFGVLMQDSFSITHNEQALMGLDVPTVYLMTRPKDAEQDMPKVKKRTLRDFQGLGESDIPSAKKDLMSFSYYLAVGNMDEAYRSIKSISDNGTIWTNMAHMCVKTKRMDVAEVCLGNMNNARGARAVREAKQEPEPEVAVAAVAIELNSLDEAEKLYLECKRYDLLVKFYQATGRWKEALSTCALHDRIHLKTCHYLYARHLESMNQVDDAISHYEKSGTHRSEVPRMLYDAQNVHALEDYIEASGDNELIKWWAQYCESEGRYDDALHYYSIAKETLALVRVYCFKEEDEKAAELCNKSQDLAACFHLARHLESLEKYQAAIRFYTKAKRYNHGIRLAKEHSFDGELAQLALYSNKDLKVEVARYFEGKGLHDKAVLLYQKGGKVSKALALCFKTNSFDALRDISDSLGADTDPELLSKCASFFMKNKQYDKAVHLFMTAKQYSKALDLCIEYSVTITEKMAELMTPPKEDFDKSERMNILLRLAQCCKEQSSYHLACKKYTQAGDKQRAMMCLIKSADTEKIIYYAAMTKKREIFILAANYLQNLNWHNNPDVMKTIISFYTKAKALEQLSSFYDACAQVEIDEYRDYEKALGALKEAMKYMIKSKAMPEKEEKLESLDKRMRLVERFVESRKLVVSNPKEMIQICTWLLDQPHVESAIRVGDVYALLIEYYFSAQEYQAAYQMIERMKGAKMILSPYLDKAMIQKIHDEVGAVYEEEEDKAGDDDDGIDEDIGDDDY